MKLRARAALAASAVVAAGLLTVTASPSRADEPVKLTDVRVAMDDGVRLAADVYLPAGTPTDGSVEVPCLVELTPYRKESRAAEAVGFLPAAGFGVIEVDARGTGGSEGEYDIVFSIREQWDGAAMVDWAADQPYCSDRVGMFGGSYSGIIQYLVASLPPERAPEHLATIAPQRAYGDLYRDIVYHGGQLIASFGVIWSGGTSAYYTEPPTDVATPAGTDAWVDHLTSNDVMLAPYIEQPYADGTYTSDDTVPAYSQRLYEDSSVLSRIEHLSVPTLHLAGWFDSFTRGQLLTFQAAHERELAGAATGPHHLIVGPWNHGGTHFTNTAHLADLQDRLVDWYGHWLRDDAAPSWFDGDRVLYYELHDGVLDDTTGAWRTSPSWPPAADYERWYLHGDGSLGPDGPAATEADASWVYDPTLGLTASPSRWDNAAGVPMAQTDQRLDGDRTAATFLTAPFATEVALTGPISARLNLATTGIGAGGLEEHALLPLAAQQLAPNYHDTDLVVKVSDVAPDGTATLLTEGFLRASHRAIDLGRSRIVDGEIVSPFHPHTAATLDPPVPGEVREYVVEVWPTAKRFPVGHRLRIDIQSADTPNHANLARPALNTLSLRAAAPSYLAVPLVPAPTS